MSNFCNKLSWIRYFSLSHPYIFLYFLSFPSHLYIFFLRLSINPFPDYIKINFTFYSQVLSALSASIIKISVKIVYSKSIEKGGGGIFSIKRKFKIRYSFIECVFKGLPTPCLNVLNGFLGNAGISIILLFVQNFTQIIFSGRTTKRGGGGLNPLNL